MSLALAVLVVALSAYTVSCLASFGAVLRERVPARESLMTRSHCSGCGHAIAPYDLVPILSYVALRGRCRACRVTIPRELFTYELVGGAIGLLIGLVIVAILAT
jgi:prepilin signal peptidase PulO-like enzyme (type II secretory pathway)